MSGRKDRQLERLAPEDRVLRGVRAIAGRPHVRSVEDHFAGYFNELGITVNLTEEALDSEVISLRNDLLEYLERTFAEQRITFTWQVSFWRGLVQVALLFPGNRPQAPEEPLELVHF